MASIFDSLDSTRMSHQMAGWDMPQGPFQQTKSPGVLSRATKIMGRVAGPALGAAFIAAPAFMTPGGIPEKARATGRGMVELFGFGIGDKVGARAFKAVTKGAKMGRVATMLGSGVARLAGGFVVGTAISMTAEAIYNKADKMVDEERARRKLNWAGDQSAFMTQKAATMRQTSLQAMNRGMMSARSMLGREGIMLHR